MQSRCGKVSLPSWTSGEFPLLRLKILDYIIQMNPITSYVFFDIETTGLPWQEKNYTKIIELCFVAVLRKDIEVTTPGNLPPVSKLTLLFNPLKKIHPEATKLTGLSNEMLRYAPTFNEKIKHFLQELPKPIALVAHNGYIFDFKILLAECKDANVNLPTDLLCIDSLIGFRKLLKSSLTHYPIKNQDVNESIDLMTSDEDEWPDFNLTPEEWLEIDKTTSVLSNMSCSNVENKGKKSKSKPKATSKVSYKLSTLYKRLLNKEGDNAHRAEADCIMLLECVIAIKHDFLPWADKACKELNQISPLDRK